MKKNLVLCTLVIAVCCSNSGVATEDTNTLEYIVREKGPHHRKVERVHSRVGAGGHLLVSTNTYFELATGLHRSVDGAYVAANPAIEAVPFGGAIAQNTRHHVSFAPTVGDANGTISLQTPDAKELVSSPFGIAYYDTASGQSVLIAELTPNVPAVLSGPDTLVYTNCFTDFAADLEYKNKLSGFEQNLVFQEQPPAPSEYGLDNDTTVVQMLTEFFDPPTPTKRSITRDGATDDAILDFGEMKIIRGKSFMAGDKSKSVVVSKQWKTLNGRKFLVEQVAYSAIEGFLSTLPAPQHASAITPENVRHIAWLENQLPQRNSADLFRMDQVEIASVSRENTGFILDYEIVGTSSDVTFKGDTTYYVTDATYLAGTNVLEGGAVIKFDPDQYSQLGILDEMICKTSPYRPAFFTSKNDDTVGEIIPGSTGNPTNYYYPGLCFANFDHAQTIIENCRFRYAGSALQYDNYPAANKIRHCQFVNCTNGATFVGLDSVSFANVLMDHVDIAFLGLAWISAEHVTMDGGSSMAYSDDIYIDFRNSLLVSVATLGTVNCNATNDNFIWLTNDPGVFQTVGAGSHYLATNSPYRNIGTNEISAQLLSELPRRTTYPPTVLNSAITSDTTLNADVARDTDDLDLGYHYDTLDFAIDAAVTNATLTLTNGVGVGVFGTTSLALESGAKLLSTGSATAMNHIVRYQCVQEQPIFWNGTNTATVNISASTNDISPSIACEFTEFVMPSLEPEWSALIGTTDAAPTNVVCKDCQIWNGTVQLDQNIDRSGTIAVNNTLFHRVSGTITSLSGATNDFEFHAGNNLFYGGTWQFDNNSSSTNWSIQNNSFDHVTLSSTATANSHNAYISSTALDGSGGNDVSLDTFSYADGPLGMFYHGQADLSDAGSVTADTIGLYHYTTTADQLKEADSTVDIGFHYVALDENGAPVDTDSDTTPDYVEDANGNGIYDGSETDWNN